MMARFAFKILILLLALPLSAQSGLNKKDFSKFWFVESESPDYTVKFLSDTCELTAPKGLTLWRKLPMSGNSVVEYDAMVVNEGHENDRDTGRGIAADFDQRYRGCEFTYATQTSSFKINGAKFSSNNPGMNFRIFWDGDEYEELLNDIDISKWKDETTTALGLAFHRGGIATFGSPASCNGTKATPCLQADLFGDWREELIFWDKTDAASLIVYSSAYTTEYRVPTLMHDHLYRMGIAWQNVAYNQPPHLGYYLPDYIESFRGIEPTGILNIEADKTKTDGKFYYLMGMPVEQPAKGVYIKNGKKLIVR